MNGYRVLVRVVSYENRYVTAPNEAEAIEKIENDQHEDAETLGSSSIEVIETDEWS